MSKINAMKLFIKLIIGIILTTTTHGESYEDFKKFMVEEIKTLKEENVKQDKEIAELKRPVHVLLFRVYPNLIQILSNLF